MEGQNTFLSFKIDIDNSSYSSTLEKSKNTLLSIAIAIGTQNSIRTGWSIDGSCYDNSTGLPKLINSKAENATDFWTINLNHISGSVLRLGVTDDATPIGTIAFVPPLSPIELKGDTRNSPVNVTISSLFSSAFSNDNVELFAVVDTSGHGFWFYSGEGTNSINLSIIGNFINQFCYPQQINSVLNGLCCCTSRRIHYSNPEKWVFQTQTRYYNGSWQNGALEPGVIFNFMSLPTNKALLSPVLLRAAQSMPYGYLSSRALSYYNNEIDPADMHLYEGKILDQGNFIIPFPQNSAWTTEQQYLCALGWSPENLVKVNPFAPAT